VSGDSIQEPASVEQSDLPHNGVMLADASGHCSAVKRNHCSCENRIEPYVFDGCRYWNWIASSLGTVLHSLESVTISRTDAVFPGLGQCLGVPFRTWMLLNDRKSIWTMPLSHWKFILKFYFEIKIFLLKVSTFTLEIILRKPYINIVDTLFDVCKHWPIDQSQCSICKKFLQNFAKQNMF